MTGVAIGHYEAKQILCNALTYNSDLSLICLPFILQLRIIRCFKNAMRERGRRKLFYAGGIAVVEIVRWKQDGGENTD